MAMKPRVLYFAVFVYFSLAGGRFTATFLEHELQLTENWMISGAIAAQLLSSSICSPWLGMVADSLETSKGGKNEGRLLIMSLGLLLSTIATLLHGVGSLWTQQNTEAFGTEDDNSHPIIPLPVLVYHLFLRALFSMGTSACMPVCDGLTLAHLEDKHEFGKERMYGAISWGIAHILLGPALDLFGFKTLYATTILAFIGCMITFQLYARSHSTTKYIGVSDDLTETSEKTEKKTADQVTETRRDYKSKSSNLEEEEIFENESASNSTNNESAQERLTFSQLARLLFKEEPILNASFIISLFALFIGMAVVESLIFLYFEFLGGSNLMCGLTVSVTVLFEIPLFHFAPAVLKFLGSPANMLQWACVAYVVRVIGYSIVPQSHPYWVLVLEPLHGITYAFAITSSVAVADRWVPKGYESSGQGILSMIRSLGKLVGLCIGGFIEDRTLYRVLAVIVTFGCCTLGMGNYLTTKDQIRREGRDPSLPSQLPQNQDLQLTEIT